MPHEQSHLEGVFETLLSIQPPIPFILSRDAERMPFPEKLVNAIEQRAKEGLALVGPWCPQQTILRHPVSLRSFESLGEPKKAPLRVVSLES